mgnify:CR=1 FL=1
MQIQKKETRQQIQIAAEWAFHQQGFAKTSMRDIAKASGVGVGNLYNYFPKGKDEIPQFGVRKFPKKLVI